MANQTLQMAIFNIAKKHYIELDIGVTQEIAELIEQQVAEKLTTELHRFADMLINRIEESVTEHTVPEGKHLVTRSYVLSTLEFERHRAEQYINGLRQEDK